MATPSDVRKRFSRPPFTIEGGWLRTEPRIDPQTRQPIPEVVGGGNPPTDPVFVKLDTTPFSVQLTRGHLSTHILFLGGIGTGKTVAISHLVERIREAEGSRPYSLVIFDTKGDYLEKFGTDQDLVLTNNPNLRGERYPRWNLFDDIGFGVPDSPSVTAERLISDMAYEISQTLFQEQIRRTNQPFFAQAASEIFFSYLSLMARWRRWYQDRRPEGIGNQDLAALARSDTKATITRLLDDYKSAPNPDPGGARGYLFGDDRLAHNILAELRQLVTKTFRGNFQEYGDFSIRRYVKSRPGKALFVEYDIQQGYLLRCAYQVLLDLAISQALGRDESNGGVQLRADTYFVIDEFALLPALQHLDAGINFGRSLGVKFILGAQNIGQVLHSYGEGLGYGILGGIGSVFEFRLFDPVSRDWVRGRYGQSYKSRTFRPAGGTADQDELGPGYVIEDWDVSALAPGWAIASVGAQDPYRVKFPPPGGPLRAPAPGPPAPPSRLATSLSSRQQPQGP